jgi:hypothetical protein
MSWDSAERRPLEIPQERVDRVIGAVLARLDAQPQPVHRPDWRDLARDWLSGLILPPRFVMPMAAAALLGLVVGQHLEASDRAGRFAELFTYSTLSVLDY